MRHRKVKDSDTSEFKQYLRQRSRHKIRKRVLYHKIQTARKDRNGLQLVLPPKYRLKALQGCYVDVGQVELERTLDMLSDDFYWPSMQKYATQHIRYCERCFKF